MIIRGSIHNFKMDKDGACKITFAIPQSDAPEATAIAMLTEKSLKIEVSPVTEEK